MIFGSYACHIIDIWRCHMLATSLTFSDHLTIKFDGHVSQCSAPKMSGSYDLFSMRLEVYTELCFFLINIGILVCFVTLARLICIVIYRFWSGDQVNAFSNHV